MPAPFDFGSIPLGECAGPQGFNVANTGDIPLTLKAIGGVSPPFRVARWRYPPALAIGEAFIVGVSFTPTAAGEFTDTLVVSFNELDATLEVPLRGMGLAAPLIEPTAAITVEASPTVPQDPPRRFSMSTLAIVGLIGALWLGNKRKR